jgi:hypothetical protein
VSTDFRLDVTINGQPLPCWDHTWWPFKIERRVLAGGFRLSGLTVLAAGRRAGLMRIRIENLGAEERSVPIRCEVAGTLDRHQDWFFLPPVSSTTCEVEIDRSTLILRQDASAIVISNVEGTMCWQSGPPAVGQAEALIPAGATLDITLVFAIGPAETARSDCRDLAADPETVLIAADDRHRAQVARLQDLLPRLSSSNPALDQWYHRSLVHLILNRWEVPEFVVNPYYGTGSIRGGCICCYVWNYGEIWEILPLVDPAANRAHIIQALRSGMTRHLAWNPVDGRGGGPWYPVNQEKIVGLVYFQVRNGGDRAFLDEMVDGRSVLDHVLDHALCGDDLGRPVDLIDYGPANDHLELRRHIHYNHVMPDLNARRHQQYLWAAELSALAGKPRPDLLARAADLKRLIRERLWNPGLRWFDVITPHGRDVRWTNQMFKLFGSTVLDTDQEAGLLGHLNEREFLSECGLHSLAKQDPAYDPADIDNGGPGSCTSFPPQIAERLYKAGHPGPASDLIRRCLWWADLMPYWSDSMLADGRDYRHDTTLQCMVDGAAIAQCVIFGVCGISAGFDGSIVINPQPSGLAQHLTLSGVRLGGRRFDVEIGGDRYAVRCDGHSWSRPVGNALTLPPHGA